MKKTLLLAISSFVLWSCTSTEEHSTHKQEATTNDSELHEEHAESLELNNGEKWLVNNEMKPFVLKGEELVNSYIQNNQTDFKKLATELKEQSNQLIKSCTMDGKSHEELHKWLHPHLELIEALDKEIDSTKAHELIIKIQKSYIEYHTYFN
jgi:hypothetical protein